jgi:hypothetical protein
MITQSQFLTRYRPPLQVGKRHRSFIVESNPIEAVWYGFSRPIARVDIDGTKVVSAVQDRGSSDSYVAVSVITWDEDNMFAPNIPNSEHYMIKPAKSVGLGYLPRYTGQRLHTKSSLIFWSAPMPYGNKSVTGFAYEIFANGLELPFNIYGYVQDQQYIPNIVISNLLYTDNYPTASATINCNQQVIS